MIDSLLQSPGMLFGAVALLAASAYFIRRALRFDRDHAAARVELIAPWTHVTADTPAKPVVAMDAALRSSELTVEEREIARRLARFKLPVRLAAAVLLGARLWAVLCLGIGAWFLLPHLLALSALPLLHLALSGSAGIFGWFLPALLAQWAAKRRSAAVVAGLPDALELLVICAEGGLALGDGLDRVVVQLQRSQPELTEELAMTAADLKILPSQDQALARLAARIDAPIVQSVVTTLSQSMRYGTPFAQAMRVVAGEIRDEALVRLEERANKLPVLLTIPMILFLMPTIFLVILGPAMLKLLDALAR